MKKAVVLLVSILMLVCITGTVWAAEPENQAGTDTEQVSALKIGQQNQPGKSLILVEAQAGAINSFVDGVETAVITLELPAGLTWARLPEIQVSSGDLELGIPYYDQAILTIPVKASSSKASVIDISGIAYNADRTVPLGTILVTIGGSALVQSDFTGRNYITREVAAECVTPAPDTQRRAELKIGSTIYRSGNKAGQLQMAPYLVNGQTYMAVRDLAALLGAEIVWDGGKQSVSMVKGETRVECSIGSAIYLLNEKAYTMAEPVVLNQGFTVLPVRTIAELFGTNVGWDGSQQSLVIESYE